MGHRKLSARTRARSRAVDTLFEAESRGFCTDPESLRGLVEKRKQISAHPAPLPAYAVQIALGVADHIDEIDEKIATFSHAWALDRMALTDLSVLRMATWEILFNEEVPDTVAINEAIAIVRLIGTDKSPGFINGLLDAIRQSKYTDNQADAYAGADSQSAEADSADTDPA